MARCVKCGKALTDNEIGLHKKMINRGATEFMCVNCLADYFGCRASLLIEKIDFFRNMGCMLFSAEPDELEKRFHSDKP